MATWLKQSTAVDIGMGPFLDSADGNSIENTLTITQPDIRLKKNGGNWAQKNAAQTLSHEENGWYEVSLDTTDTNTLGILIVAIHESGALPVWREFMVVPANVYDSMIGGSDNLQVDTVQIEGADATDTINAQADLALSDYDPPTNAELVSEINSVQSDIAALNNLSAADVGDAVLDEVVEGSITLRQSIRGHNAALLGKSSGLETSTALYRDLADSKNRIDADVDTFGNRSTVTLDLT